MVAGYCYGFEGDSTKVTQAELRIALGLPAGPPGLGITIDGERFHLEFPADNQQAQISAAQLQRLLAKKVTVKT